MTNMNIQANIPLVGRGLVYHENGLYGAGEYRRLMDVEITKDGNLSSRRPIVNMHVPANNFDLANNFYKFIGTWGSAGVYWDKDGVYCVDEVSTYNDIRIVKTADLPVTTNLGVDYKTYPVGFHHYNDIDHFVTFKLGTNTLPASPTYQYNVYTRNNASNFPVTIPSEFAGFTSHPVISSTLNNANNLTAPVKTFVHKERLWIVTKNFAYFSKATDFTNFTPPDGGFFKFGGQEINDAIAIKDSIYIICDSAVFVITYSTDPNVDALVRQLSEGVGGDTACVYEDTPYFVKQSTLYAVNGTNVVKMFDFDIDLETSNGVVPTLTNKSKIVSFGTYIVLLRYFNTPYSSDTPVQAHVTPNLPIHALYNYTPAQAPNEMFPSLYFLNMENGAVHGVMFSDSEETVNQWARGYPVDMLPSVSESDNGGFNLYIASSQVTVTGGNFASSKGHLYSMKREEPIFTKTQARDRKWNNTTNTLVDSNYDIEIEFSSFVPDGNEYLLKRFRDLMCMTKMPYTGCRFSVAYDNGAFGVAKALDQTKHIDAANSRPPYPMRLPLNQRGRSISLRFDMDPAAAVPTKQEFYLTDIKLLWDYTKRAPAQNKG